MLTSGHAVAARAYLRGTPSESAYLSAGRAAQQAQRGLWQGAFDMPWVWRRLKKDERVCGR